MTSATYKKCERCGKLYEIAYNYNSYKFISKNRVRSKFSGGDYYDSFDFCYECLNDFWIMWDKFIPAQIDNCDLEEQVGDI